MKTLAFAAILVTSVLPSARADQGPSSRGIHGATNWCAKPYIDDSGASVKAWAVSHLTTRWFSELSEMHRQTVSADCNDLAGRPQLGHFLSELEDFFSSSKAWDKNLELIAAFRKAMPHDPLPPLLEASYWKEYAWDARGHGYASSVSSDGWKLFRERAEKAKKVLDDSKSYASTSPEWYLQMLVIQSALGTTQRERDTLFVEGVRRFPWYLRLHLTRANYLAPWWGGDWDSVDNLALWSAEQTKTTLGNALYAHVYWSVSGHESVKNLFKDTKASWPKMKLGFDDMMRQFPESKRNLNAYARFACDAGDKQTYLALRKKLVGKALDDSLWGTKHHEVCDAKFGYKI